MKRKMISLLLMVITLICFTACGGGKVECSLAGVEETRTATQVIAGEKDLSADHALSGKSVLILAHEAALTNSGKGKYKYSPNRLRLERTWIPSYNTRRRRTKRTGHGIVHVPLANYHSVA